MTTQNYKTLGKCCPVFDPGRWNNRSFDWVHKLFIKASIPTLFHIPFPPMIGKKVTRMTQMAEDSDALAPDKLDSLLLFNDPHPFKSQMYLSVTDQVPEADNTALSGKFFSKVYEGAYNTVPKYIKQMNNELTEKGQKAIDYYVHYAYCPKCAKEAGNNYIVIFAKIADS